MVQWTLTDNSTGSPVVFTFPVNPNAFTPPGRNATIATTLGTAPDSIAILMQGRDAVRSGSFSGAVLTQAFFLNLQTEADKAYPLELADDQGTIFDILITGIKWERIRRFNHPFRHDYTIDFIEVT